MRRLPLRKLLQNRICSSVLSAVSTHCKQNNLEKNLRLTVHHDWTSRQELRAGPWGQELMQRLQRDAAYRLAPQGLLRLLLYISGPTGDNHPLGSASESIFNQENALQMGSQAHPMETIP